MDDNFLELANYWIEKSEASFKSAKSEYDRGNLDFCINRLYYAVFYAVSSNLIIKGISYKKHSAVRAALHRDFVKTGLVSVKYGKLYDALLRDREEADYVALVNFDKKLVKKNIKKTNGFINVFKTLLQKECNKENNK